MYFLAFVIGMLILAGLMWLIWQLIPYLIAFVVLTAVVMGVMHLYQRSR